MTPEQREDLLRAALLDCVVLLEHLEAIPEVLNAARPRLDRTMAAARRALDATL